MYGLEGGGADIGWTELGGPVSPDDESEIEPVCPDCDSFGGSLNTWQKCETCNREGFLRAAAVNDA